MNKFHIMDHTGHTTVEFDPADKLSTEQAMQRFAELTGEKKMVAAEMHALGPGQHRKIEAFDPAINETLFIPQLVGG